MLLDFVRARQLLLILDNCEHLSEACAQLAQELLSVAPELRILATSREPLAIAGETLYAVSGLSWPSLAPEQNENLQALMQYDAVRLLVERARANSSNFNLNSENAWSVVEICRRLDGLPLALELVSGRVNVLTVQEIAARLNDQLNLLVSSQRHDSELRHHTLRATIDWSYGLLQADEQLLLRRLAVFEAGCTLDTAEVVCSGEGIAAGRILELISSLSSKSLLVAETVGRAQARYRLLDTIREFALERLAESGETGRLRDRHLELFLTKTEETAPKLNGAYQQLWLNWLEGEHDNLRTALAWSLESGHIEAGLRIASALVRFWEIRGYVKEGMRWFERFLVRADESISLVVHAYALAYASFLAMFLGDAASATSYGQTAVSLAEAAGDEGRDVLSIALSSLASGARTAGDYGTAITLEERTIHLLRESSGPPFFLGMALLGYGSVAIELGEYEKARTSLEESLAIAQESGDSFRIGHTLNALGDLARCEQRYADAQTAYKRGAARLREVGAQRDLASVLQNLGYTCLRLGEVERAHSLFRESLAAHQAMPNVPGMVESLVGFAAIALLRGLPAEGARLLSAAEAIGGRRTATASVWLVTRMEYEHYLNLARASLPDSELLAAQAAGRDMPLEQALTYAQNLPLEAELAPTSKETPDSLTGREREVAALIGQGKTNSEIADKLVLSKRTVETHVSNILSKLGLTGRGQVMLWAIDRGLNQPPQ
jgi:non-specific serine/threonine protein kinase